MDLVEKVTSRVVSYHVRAYVEVDTSKPVPGDRLVIPRYADQFVESTWNGTNPFPLEIKPEDYNLTMLEPYIQPLDITARDKKPRILYRQSLSEDGLLWRLNFYFDYYLPDIVFQLLGSRRVSATVELSVNKMKFSESLRILSAVLGVGDLKMPISFTESPVKRIIGTATTVLDVLKPMLTTQVFYEYDKGGGMRVDGWFMTYNVTFAALGAITTPPLRFTGAAKLRSSSSDGSWDLDCHLMEPSDSLS